MTEWLRDDYGVGRGHAMAFCHVLKNDPTISAKHIGTVAARTETSPPRLQLDGRSPRQTTGSPEVGHRLERTWT